MTRDQRKAEEREGGETAQEGRERTGGDRGDETSGVASRFSLSLSPDKCGVSC